jgi:hypothetical protein
MHCARGAAALRATAACGALGDGFRPLHFIVLYNEKSTFLVVQARVARPDWLIHPDLRGANHLAPALVLRPMKAPRREGRS